MSNTNKRSAAAKTQQELQQENLESYKIIDASAELESTIEPRMDYADPSTFATYGSAEEYYTSAIKNIYNFYPYDGSKYEKLQWHISGSGLDNQLFENEYPRTHGYVSISHDGWGAQASATGNYRLPVNKEYITLHGGPNTDASAYNLASLFPSDGGKANIISDDDDREANLTLGAGNTVEFWMRVPAFAKPHEVVFDMVTTGSTDSGRFCIYLDEATDSVGLQYKANSDEISGLFATNSIPNADWHHYAVTVSSNGTASLHVDGTLSSGTVVGATTQEIEGPFIANIGAYMSASAADSATSFPVNTPGWCKFSGSLDEFRFWKTTRTGEQIGLNWTTQVYGGTNTDTSNTDLGVYYKFNEGIVGTSVDSTVLDFSGRISNGTWTGYSAGARSTGSAMIESSASLTEFKDPIIYSTHPDVAALKETNRVKGLVYDQQNNASLYNSIPSWIREDDVGEQNILKLTQIMSSYLDTLQNQLTDINKIKDVGYPSGSQRPYNFINRNLRNLGFESEDFFIDATLLERFMDQNTRGNLEFKLSEIKDLIYQNIYNNLTYIMTSKGTEKSFRNLVRCFGVDDELVKLNIYSNGERYDLEDRYAASVIKKPTISFNDPSRFEATMFQTQSTVLPALGFISSSGELARLNGICLEGDILFPKQKDVASQYYFDIPFTKSSLFGMKETNKVDYDWVAPDKADLQVYVVREETNSANAYFQLTSSELGIDLTSSIFPDVYENERWVLAAKVRNPAIDTDEDYFLDFQGVNSDGETIQNSFSLSASLPNADALSLLDAPKRIFAGAYKTNFTGSTVNKSDVLVSAIRYWGKHVSDAEITSHAKDAKNFGLKDPNRPLFGATDEMASIDTLKLHWNFELVTTSSSGGEFAILDYADKRLEEKYYGDFTNVHDGKGYGFPANSAKVVDLEYVNTLTRITPDVSNGSDMVSVLSAGEQIREELSKPTNLIFSIEKSLYQTISDEMIRYFSTIQDFASLYNSPADKYRNKRAELEVMRRNFFDRMENSPDVNKFYEYFKWIDDAVVGMLRQILPAGAEVIDGSINIIEGHVLERNKFEHKVPSYVVEQESTVVAPIQNVSTNNSGNGVTDAANYSDPFWNNRPFLELPDSILSGNPIVDGGRLNLLNVVHGQPRTVSQFETSEDTSALEKRDTNTNVPETGQLNINSSDLAETPAGNNKIKITGRVVKTG